MTNSSYDPDRRDFVKSGISMGFALAVMPVAAWAVTTSGDGLEAGIVEIPLGDGKKLPAYRAYPKKKSGKLPVVLVIQEIFGIHEHIQDVCRRFANQGYLAIAPSLYFREGDVTKASDIAQIRANFVSKTPEPQVLADLDATVAWLGKHEKQADLTRLGITGFCWGGLVTWLYSAHSSKVKVGVAWYGRLVTPLSSDDAGTHKAFEVAPKLKAPVLGLYGGKDKGIPAEDVAKMREALAKGKGGSEIVVYPEAEHGFYADYRPSYNAEAAKDAWEKALAWFKKHGVV